MSAVPATIHRVSLVQKFAAKYSLEPEKLLATLKATAFKPGKEDPEVTNEQMAALLVVADQYGLNPFTKELFAFPDKHKGIVPIVSVDGWARIVNERPEFNGMEFVYGGDGPAWIECHIHRKDREHPIKVRELMSECKRNTGPWGSHPSRMLRHKAFIQCARLAFGFGGIYDEDEGERIIGEHSAVNEPRQSTQRGAAGLKAAIVSQTAEAPSTDQPKEEGRQVGTLDQRDGFIKKFSECNDTEILALVADELRGFDWSPADQAVINDAYNKRAGELGTQEA